MLIRHFRYGPETNSSYTNVLVIPPRANPTRFEGALRLRYPDEEYYCEQDPGTVAWFFYCVARHLNVEDRFLELLKKRGVDVVPAKVSCDAFYHNIRLEGPPEDLASYLADLCRFALNNRAEIVGVHDSTVDVENEEFINTVLPFCGYLWKNGNYYIILFGPERSKVRIAFHNDVLKPEYPELVDVKITNRCYHECSWCAEGSVADGADADGPTVRDFLKHLHPGVEVTIGGGDPLLHLMLHSILRTRKFVSITVRDTDVLNGRVTPYVKLEHVRLGVSLSPGTDADELVATLRAHRSPYWPTVHWVHGVNTLKQLRNLVSSGAPRVLILGYKPIGRGAFYTPKLVRPEQFREVMELARNHRTTSLAFDHLAIEQFGLREYILDHPLLYGGAEGRYSFFVDFVDMSAYPSSDRFGGPVSLPREPYKGWEQDVFLVTRGKARSKGYNVRTLTLLPGDDSIEPGDDRVRVFTDAVKDILNGHKRLVELWVHNRPHRLREVAVRADCPHEVELRWEGDPEVLGPSAEVTVNGVFVRVPTDYARKVKINH